MLSFLSEGQQTMKRFLASALIVGVSTFGLVGCDQKSEVKEQTTVKTPAGTDTITKTTEEKQTGDAKDPAPTTPPVEAPK